MADLPKLAGIGDSVECDVRHPYPRTIRLVLETREAAAHANDLLMDPKSGWRLSAACGVKACGSAEFMALVGLLEAAVFATGGDPSHPEVVKARDAVRAAYGVTLPDGAKNG